MKVWELIEKLERMDPGLDVYARLDEEGPPKFPRPIFRRMTAVDRVASNDMWLTPVALVSVGEER